MSFFKSRKARLLLVIFLRFEVQLQIECDTKISFDSGQINGCNLLATVCVEVSLSCYSLICVFQPVMNEIHFWLI